RPARARAAARDRAPRPRAERGADRRRRAAGRDHRRPRLPARRRHRRPPHRRDRGAARRLPRRRTHVRTLDPRTDPAREPTMTERAVPLRPRRTTALRLAAALAALCAGAPAQGQAQGPLITLTARDESLANLLQALSVQHRISLVA